MNPKPIEQARTPDLRHVMAAMKRAARRARVIAARTGTPVVIFVDGEIVFETVPFPGPSIEEEAG